MFFVFPLISQDQFSVFLLVHTHAHTHTFSLSIVMPTHRDIASAIKDVLEDVNDVSQKHNDNPKMVENKKVRVVYSPSLLSCP